MRHKLFIIISTLIAAFLLASCTGTTYAQKRKKEKAKLASYIKDNNLIIKEGTEDSLALIALNGSWPEKTYYKTYCGAYLRISKTDLNKRKPAEGNTIVMRWKVYDLDGNQTGDNTDPSISREGTLFVYTPGSYTPSQGWNSCIPFMRHDCNAEFIIESPIGPQEQLEAVVTLRVDVVDFTVTN